MKVSVSWIVLIVFAFMSVAFSTEDTVSLIPAGLASQHQVTETRMILKTRRLKDGGRSSSPKMDEAGNVDLDDYRPIDPSPSSKASIRPGPIQHGTPYMPYIPKLSPPPPPPHPKQGGSP